MTCRATSRLVSDSWSRSRWWKIASGPPDTTAAARDLVTGLNSNVVSADEVIRSGSSNMSVDTAASVPPVTAIRRPFGAAAPIRSPGTLDARM